MIIDVHSHFWEYPKHFDDSFRLQAARARAGVEVDLTVRYEEYRRTAPDDLRTIVWKRSYQKQNCGLKIYLENIVQPW